MTTTFLQINTRSANKNLIAFIAVVLFSTLGMYGQNVKNEIVAPANGTEVSIAAANLNTESQMELVSWFMGSKASQMSSSNNVSNATSTNNSGKKQLINCGATPNRILSRAFLKKAINHDSTIA